MVKFAQLFLLLAFSTLNGAEQVEEKNMNLNVAIHPTELFIANKPLIIQCTASPVLKVWLQCENIRKTFEENILSNEEKVMIVTFTIPPNIIPEGKKEPVICRCAAADLSGQKTSEPAKIYRAYIEDEFVEHPLSATVENGITSLALFCKPPEGKPKPTISWLYNGKPLKSKELLATQQNSLIFPPVTRKLEGAYVCVATNMAGNRSSESAVIKVYVDGGWSKWSPYSDCERKSDRKCGLGKQVATRLCNNPKPYGKGAKCMGKSTKTIQCSIVCAEDGKWSEWGYWSMCHTDCRQIRRRECSQLPISGGHSCSGSAAEYRNCTTDKCDRASNLPHDKSNVYMNSIFVTIFIVSLVCIFIVCILIVVCCIQHRRNYGIFHTPIENGHLPPEAFHASMRVCHKYPDGNMVSKAGICHCECCPTNHNQQLTQTGFSHQVYPFKDGPPSPNYYEALNDDLVDYQFVRGSYPSYKEASFTYQYLEMPKGIESHCMARGKVGYAGGRLCIPNARVSLLVPEGAIPRGEQREIYVAVARTPKEYPSFNSNALPLSSLIVCGPTDVEFVKPVILSFPHCGEGNEWQMQVFHGNNWSPLINFFHTDPRECFVITERISPRYCMLGTPIDQARRRFAVLAFTSIEDELAIRVYVVPDCGDTLQNVIDSESGMGGRQMFLDDNKLFISYPGGKLSFKAQGVNEGHSIRSGSHNEATFNNVWNCVTYVCFTVVLNRTANSDLIELDLMFGQADVLSLPVTMHASSVQNYNSIPDESLALGLVFRLPEHVKQHLAQSLNAGNAWHQLAIALGMESCISYFATATSPSELLLNFWESRHRESSALSQLVNHLRQLQLSQLAIYLQNELGQWL